MHPLVGQREYDALINILCERHFPLGRRNPHHLAVVVGDFVREADEQRSVESDGQAAIFQAAVAGDGHRTADDGLQREHRLAPFERDPDREVAVLDVGRPIGLEQRIIHLEIKAVGAVFQPFPGDCVLFRHIHRCADLSCKVTIFPVNHKDFRLFVFRGAVSHRERIEGTARAQTAVSGGPPCGASGRRCGRQVPLRQAAPRLCFCARLFVSLTSP